MLNNIRNFAKTKSAGVLVGILIIPFVLWGMGGVFSGGNTNNVAKINNQNISTKDFITFLNRTGVDEEVIRNNIDNNILEENLAKLISSTMINMEIRDLNLFISDKVLSKSIKESQNFKDENNKFSRIKYEKFLLSSNISAPEFELTLRDNELKKELFNYISGGVKTPDFLVKNNYKQQTKNVTIDFLNLSKVYKKKENFTKQEVLDFINENKENLKEKFVNFKYSKITPKELIGIDQYNNLFFEKIDEIENEISKGVKIETIGKSFNLKIISKNNYGANNEDLKDRYFKKIYEKASENKIELLDENDFYVLYEITQINETLPSIDDDIFISKVKEKLFKNSKFKFNNELIKKISDEKFSQSDYEELSNKNLIPIERIKINSINDNNMFSKDSVVFLYSLAKNNFGLIGDKEKNIYLIKIIDINFKNELQLGDNYPIYESEEKKKLIDYIYETYDLFLNEKYKVKVNDKTMERVKNYFR